MKKALLSTMCIAATTLASSMAVAAEQPNVLVIWGDDIGYGNISAYNNGVLGYQTPNIDSIAEDGAMFTSYYGQQSCTAGRSAFITGQSPRRTGLTKVGMPGAAQGIQLEDITLATILKDNGYNTGQFGKNHLGDTDDKLPTNHGFDEFLGNLYHLNAEEEPEIADYPSDDPEFMDKFSPRGVIHSYADGRIEDTGPLTRKRMETVDEETYDAAVNFMERSVKEEKPFFVWWNSTRMHIWTHLKESSVGKTGLGTYADGMVEHDQMVGSMLQELERLGVDDNTIVYYSTDNGAMKSTFPDSGISPFRGEKNTGWEGGFRVPAMVKWPAAIPSNQKLNGIVSAKDMFSTIVDAAGAEDTIEELKTSYTSPTLNRTYKNHIDGVSQLDYLTGKSDKSARDSFFYWSDDGELLALRMDRWKIHFKIQEAEGIEVWSNEFTNLRMPIFFDLSVDPYEEADKGVGYRRWWMDRLFVLYKAQAEVGEMLGSFKEYPPRQEIASFSVDKILLQLERASNIK